MFSLSLSSKLGLCLLLVAIADGLFYQQPIGWTLGFYSFLLFCLLVTLNRALLATRLSQIIAMLCILLLMTLIDAPQFLAELLFILGMMTLLILVKRGYLPEVLLWLKDVSSAFVQSVDQFFHIPEKITRIHQRKAFKLKLRYAVIPSLLTALFIGLFIKANPLIAQVIDKIDWRLIQNFFSMWRIAFWLVIAASVWVCIRPRFSLKEGIISNKTMDLARWFSPNTIELSLLIFNALFGLQNGLDILFLWSGGTLPNGLSYAEYAHAGAYPLLVISLITVIYVVITFNEHQPQYQTVLSTKLVFVWLAQNIFLLISAINRLMQYIEVYSLTYLRIIALCGMALTALCMLLILVRIYYHRSNLWLINSNALAIIATLYISCFINIDSIIAHYNVRHALEVTGQGTSVDLSYLHDLGSEALPALYWFQANAKYSPSKTAEVSIVINKLESKLHEHQHNWRAWTWRNYRQHRSLKVKSEQIVIPIGKDDWQIIK